MVRKKEMEIILKAAEAYRKWSRYYPSVLPMVKRMSAKTDMPSPPDENIFSLDDACEFDNRDYTVKQLIAQMKRGSGVGQKFAEAVYEESQRRGMLEKMTAVSDSKGVDGIYGDGKIPADEVIMACEGAIKLADYMMAIYGVTHPKKK